MTRASGSTPSCWMPSSLLAAPPGSPRCLLSSVATPCSYHLASEANLKAECYAPFEAARVAAETAARQYVEQLRTQLETLARAVLEAGRAHFKAGLPPRTFAARFRFPCSVSLSRSLSL